MEITPWTIYWITRLDGFNSLLTLFSVIAIVSIVAGLIAWMIVLSDCDPQDDAEFARVVKKTIKISAIAFVVCCIGASLLPSTKQFAAMIVIPKIANSEKIPAIGNKVYDLAIEWLEELKPCKKEGAE